MKVFCQDCNWKALRSFNEDTGTYGPCSRCGGVMGKPHFLIDKRIRKAKAQLREMGAE